jgi:hypothetical protein
MGKFSLASRLADEAGVAFSRASQFVDDVGAPAARQTLDSLSSRAGQTVEDWWKPATAVGGVVGGGALVWRQQDLDQAREITEQQQSYGDAVGSIMESDLPPAAKQDLVDSLLNKSPASGGGGGGGGGDDGGGLLGGGVQTTLVLVIVVAFALKFTLGDDN